MTAPGAVTLKRVFIMTTISQTAPSATLSELFSLLKPRVMTLVVFTGAIGMWLALEQTHHHLHPFLQCLTIACIALGSGAGGLINMWYDRDIDAIMTRTARRPIPSGTVQADDVLATGVMLALTSVMIMGLATNWIAAGLLAFAIFFYAVIYTMWLKRHTPQNIVIGGAAGAFPPMIGWAAVSGSVGIESIILFLIIFLWTPPHFWALALFKHEDYRKAEVPMLPVTHGNPHTARQMLYYSVLLLAVSLAPVYIGMNNWLYGAGAALLGLYLLWLNLAVYRQPHATPPARRMFAFSILYLFAIFALMMVDTLLIPIHNG